MNNGEKFSRPVKTEGVKVGTKAGEPAGNVTGTKAVNTLFSDGGRMGDLQSNDYDKRNLQKETRKNKDEKHSNKDVQSAKGLSAFLRFGYFPILFMLMELFFHVYYFRAVDTSIIYAVLFGAAFGFLLNVVTMLFPEKVNKVIAMLSLVVICVSFNLQLVYGHIFKTFISLYSVRQNAGDASEFWKEALHGIYECLPGVMALLILPIVLTIILEKRRILVLRRESAVTTIFSVLGTAALFAANILFLALPGTGAHTPYDLFHNNFMLDLGIEKLGVMTSTCFDVKQVVFGAESSDVEEYTALSSLLPDANPTVAPAAVTPSPTPTLAPSVTPTPTPIPIDTSPNVLDIDFAGLAQAEKNSSIRSLHEYMANAEPTKKNEYTGLFKDFNVIYMTCEGYSPWAVDEKLTPTLYRLTHSGFVFNNFYTPIWYTSTSDGEYVECMSLLPYSTNSFKRSKKNALPFCLGNIMGPLGYKTLAYHAHTATYYGRNETHPNMGYEFKAKKAGLQMTDVWPESDLEMIMNSLPDYINENRFSIYYMTVSGHMEYNFGGNTQAAKHKDEVKDLPYSEAVRAYIACNIELDRALEYLIFELEKAGIADKTVIAFGADHYPYGLTNEQIDERAGHKVEENFELYKNNFVLWSEAIEEPIYIDKYCSSLDMLPTVLNLLGIDYDSRLLMGSDILSDSPALVIFSNQSFITDYCMYNSKNKEIMMLEDVELPEGYIDSVTAVVRNKFEVSKNILLNDYYRYLHLSE